MKTMKREMKDTELKTAEYTDTQKKRPEKIIRLLVACGMLIMGLSHVLKMMDLTGTVMTDFVQGAGAGMIFGALILMILDRRGAMAKVHAFKMRMLHRRDA